MAKINRNALCPCGSGKKYKRCCLRKEQEQEQALMQKLKDELQEQEKMAATTPAKNAPDNEFDSPDCEQEDAEVKFSRDLGKNEIRAFWKDFSGKDYDGQISVFLEKLDDEEWLDDDVAFDMLDGIYHQATHIKDWKRVNELLTTFEKKRPQIYKKSRQFYLKWQIESAIIDQCWEEVPSLVMKMSKIAHKHIDEFSAVVDWLVYYGQIPLLVKATKTAWPKVEKSVDIVPWGIDEFAENAANYLIFDHLETHPLNVDVDELFQQISYYGDFKTNWLPNYIPHITGEADCEWTMDDFNLSTRDKKRKHKKKSEQSSDNKEENAPDGKSNLYYLSVEFLGYLRREKKVPYPKGETARENIQKYLLDRHAGELEHRESMLEAMIRESPGKCKPKEKKRRIENILCPDCETLDRYMTRFFDFLGQRPHAAATMFELLPEWLVFLESYNLLNQQLRQKTLSSLQQLKESLVKILRKEADGPTLEKQIQERWDRF